MGEVSPVSSPSTSPGGSVLSWESVALSPLEMLSLQYEHQLQQLEDAHVSVKQNKNGVDIDPQSGKAAGRVIVKVLAVHDVNNLIIHHPLLNNSSIQLSLYVSTVITPSSACEKSTKKHGRTSLVTVFDGQAQWKESIVFDGIKNKSFVIKVSVVSCSDILADIPLGDIEIPSHTLIDQKSHQEWYDLKSSTASNSAVCGKLLLCATFEHNAQAKHDEQVALLRQQKKNHDEYLELYRKTAPLLNAQHYHPAAYGNQTARAQLHIPGIRFRSEWHHPGAVTASPLPDKCRVVTPFGHGIIISFRPETKMYIVQLDKDPAAKNAKIAYIRLSDVQEESNEPIFKMFMKVQTPYGSGEIIEIRPSDDVIVVKTAYAKLYMHRKDVQLPIKSAADMNNKELIEHAVAMTESGNELFRGNECDAAVSHYLHALTYLQRIDQEIATHKEKATILQTMIRCHLNIGTCKLKTDSYQDAEVACTNALSILTVLAENKHGNVVTWMGRLGLSEHVMFEEWPSKARFRRAKAYVKQERYMEAKQDLTIAVRLNPKDRPCRLLLDQVTKQVTKMKSLEKKAWGGIFDEKGVVNGEKPIMTATKSIEKQDISAAKTVDATPLNSPDFNNVEIMEQPVDPAPSPAPWFLSTRVLTTASIVTASVAALAVVALKHQKS